MTSNQTSKPAAEPVHLPAGGDAFWNDPGRRRHLEDLARQLSGDRPRARVLERIWRFLLRRRRER